MCREEVVFFLSCPSRAPFQGSSTLGPQGFSHHPLCLRGTGCKCSVPPHHPPIQLPPVADPLVRTCCSVTHVQLFAIPWTKAHQASLSSTTSWSLFKFISIESVILSNQLILCHTLFLLLSIFPSIRVFSNESVLPIRWPKY